jgi:hypothetical protein
MLLVALLGAQAAEAKQTSLSSQQRFEVIQSNLVRRLTFKLDKFTGDVFLMVKDSNDRTVWEKMVRQRHPQDRVSNRYRVNYQISLSELVAADTFLTNISTGATWQCVQAQDGDLVWEAMK